MVKHIVLFRLDKEVSEEVRHEAMVTFKKGIEALPAVIPFIRSIQVSFNVNPAEQFDLCLESAFDSLDDVNTYSIHPAHKQVAEALKPLITARACVDYEA